MLLDKKAIRDTILYGKKTEAVQAVMMIRGYEYYPVHYDMVKQIELNERVIIECPRGIGKTLSANHADNLVDLVRWHILDSYESEIRILIVSRGDTQSKAMGKEIREIIECNGLFRDIFPEIRPGKPWNEHEFNIANRKNTSQEPNVSCYSMCNSVMSKHFDKIVCDDLVSYSSARSETEREKTKDWFQSTLLPTLKGNNLVVIGTPYHKKDLLAELAEEKIGDKLLYKHVKYPVIVKKNGLLRSICPSILDMNEIKQKRAQMSESNFWMQYMMERNIKTGDKLLTEDDIEFFNGYRKTNSGSIEILDDNDKVIDICSKVYFGTDLAVCESDSSDYFAFSIIGLGDRTGKYFILDIFRRRVRLPEQQRILAEYYKLWKPKKVGIEANGPQGAVVTSIESSDKCFKNKIYRIKTSQDKETKLETFAIKIYNKDVVFNKNMESTDLQDVMYEITEFPYAVHDDIFDCVFMGCHTCDQCKGSGNFLV